MASKNKIKKSAGSIVFDVLNYAFITFFCITIIFPVWDLVVISFSRSIDVSYLRTNLWPKVWNIDAYKYVFTKDYMLIAARNSVARTVLGTVYHLVICCMGAFVLTRDEMPGRKFFTVAWLITMYFGGGLIPTYLNIKSLNLTENFLVYVIPGGFSMYNTIIIRNYFFSIDKAMEEAATIDGASMLQVLFKIIVPLSKPVLATVGLWQMVGQWNSWFDNMIYCRSDELITLQYLLRKLTIDTQALVTDSTVYSVLMDQAFDFTPETIQAATTVVVITPIICVYPFLQKYFVKGIMLGAVKG